MPWFWANLTATPGSIVRVTPAFTVTVPVTRVMAGGKVEVPTIEGTIIKVPLAGRNPNRPIAVRGKGMPVLKSTDRGNLRVHLEFEVPQELTAEQQDLVNRLDESVSEAQTPAYTDYLRKLGGPR